MSSSYLYLNGLRVHYLRWDQDRPGLPVVLLHGLASNARIWELAAPYLVERGVAPLAPDQRGHGLTDKPEGGYSFDSFHNDLRAVVAAHDLERPVLVGHSWGAMVALDYAARLPFGALSPAGLVLVDGGMTQMDDVPGATWEAARQRLAPPRLAGTPLETFLEHFSRPDGSWRPDDRAVQIILANFEISDQETISPHLSFDHHMQIVRAMWEFKTYERFERVRCPVRMISALPHEPQSPAEQEYVALKQRGIDQARRKIEDLDVHWMPDTVHDIPLQHPAELADLIADFSTKCGRS